MSFFNFSITTPKNTAKTSKKRTEITLAPGIIHRVRVRIPPGSKGVLHCYVNHHLHQLYPANTGEDFHGDDEEIDFRDFYEIKGLDTQLDVYTWNTSTLYDHEILLHFGILPKWVLIPYAVGKAVKNTWSKLVGTWR